MAMADLVDEPDLLERLSALDAGLADSSVGSRPLPPPLIDRLAIPLSRGRWRTVCEADRPDTALQNEWAGELEHLDARLLESGGDAPLVFSRSSPAITPLVSKHARGRPRLVSSPPGRDVAANDSRRWLVSGCLVLLTLVGAASAVLTFHERLSFAIESRLK
jgi:hypothetical protein